MSNPCGFEPSRVQIPGATSFIFHSDPRGPPKQRKRERETERAHVDCREGRHVGTKREVQKACHGYHHRGVTVCVTRQVTKERERERKREKGTRARKSETETKKRERARQLQKTGRHTLGLKVRSKKPVAA